MLWDSLCPFLCSWRERLGLLWLSSLGFHDAVLLNIPLYLHTKVFDMKIDDPVFDAIETEIEYLPIEL
jgi:hypothetical protein